MLNYKYIFQIKYTEAILSNSTLKLLWFEISKIDSNRELECSSPDPEKHIGSTPLTTVLGCAESSESFSPVVCWDQYIDRV